MNQPGRRWGYCLGSRVRRRSGRYTSDRHGQPRVCHPRSRRVPVRHRCGRWHPAGDPLIGTRLDRGGYAYAGQLLSTPIPGGFGCGSSSSPGARWPPPPACPAISQRRRCGWRSPGRRVRGPQPGPAARRRPPTARRSRLTAAALGHRNGVGAGASDRRPPGHDLVSRVVVGSQRGRCGGVGSSKMRPIAVEGGLSEIVVARYVAKYTEAAEVAGIDLGPIFLPRLRRPQRPSRS